MTRYSLAHSHSCPQLRYIATSIGVYLPPHGSHVGLALDPCQLASLIPCQLFDFVDLAGFALTLSPGFYDVHTDTFTDGANSVLLISPNR